MAPIPSRHDLYPHADTVRRRAIAAAAAPLAACWHDCTPGCLLAAIEAVADAPPEMAIANLMPWLADPKWLTDRLEAALALLRADPFARPPLRLFGAGDGPGGLILAEQGAIRLSLQLWPIEAAAAPTTVLFVPGAAAIRVLAAGGAAIGLHRVAVTAAEEAGAFTTAAAARCISLPPRPLGAAEVVRLDTSRENLTLSGAAGDVLLLELAVQPPSRLPVRAYDIASGRLVHTAASRRDSSFRAMALALLREMRRHDAVPLLALAAENEDFAARWGAMRELVALDPAAARPHLAAMATADPHPEIRRAAAATLALFGHARSASCPA